MSLHKTLIFQAQVDGEFTGWDGDTLFKLSNGTYWLQAEYNYWYHYAYCPYVELYRVRTASGGASAEHRSQSPFSRFITSSNPALKASLLAGTATPNTR